jgi:hypothetical protein
MILLYIFISYMIMLGMVLETYDGKSIPAEAWFMVVLSPVILPVLIGSMLIEKSKRNNE